MGARPNFSPGHNIAIKVPSFEYAATVAFYRDMLALEQLTVAGVDGECSAVFQFGDKRLWIDSVATLSQAEVWLEIVTDDAAAAGDFLKQRGVASCNAIEPLPETVNGFWVSSPSNIIHLIHQSA